MSRIGNNPIAIPEGVTVTQEDTVIKVIGKLGELSQDIDSAITVAIVANVVTLSRSSSC